jgi:signal transduction histidine kinase
MLFLVLFSAIVSVFLLGIVYHEQRQSLQSALYATENGNVAIPNLANSNNDNLYFFYILDNVGNFVAGSEAFPKTRNQNLGKISGWHPYRDDFRLDWSPASHNHRDVKKSKGKDQIFFLGARPFTTKDGKTETIYVAKDVTFYYEVIKNLIGVILSILVLFFIVAVWFSNSMSKKAMIPIQRAYKQQQQFLADASHELRTPLSIMNTSLDVIELENEEVFSPYTKEVLSDMKEEVGWMSRMVQHLLMLARSDSGSVQFEMASFDLVPKVRQWVQSFEALAKKKQISIQTEFPEMMVVTGDIERIKQVVYIILDNAMKYTPEEGSVDVVLEMNPKQWSLSIRDTGVGIPEEEKQRIFDRFYRMEKHRSRGEGSAGLGLSIAKWIVEAHQGSIEVVSVVSKGSTFIVKIPN